MKKFALTYAGHFFLGLGIIGAFLPILPTTPFLLLAAYFYSQTNHELHQWLYNHKYFGPPLRDWDEQKVIGFKAKIIATAMITLVLFWRIPRLEIATLFKVIIVVVLAGVLAFIWTRPSRRI
jgi:uncharacterized membrane protein YbaN (DUF454 family)